ncbi:MAG: CPBP family intramembrane metalloprotease [Epsilonproteobacteria bacterium]|nr:CPBP family intramembrane metalloprotease [Campylobacterota bacterium]
MIRSSILKDQKFYFLWLASTLSAISVLPYVAATHGGIVITPKLLAGALTQAALLYGIIVFFGLKMSNKLSLKLIPSNNFLIPSVVSGLAVGSCIKLLDKFVFIHYSNVLNTQITDIAAWKGFLASFYGAINEEVLLRLFAVSLFTLLLQRFSKITKSGCIIISIIFCAVLFGAGHLPTLYRILKVPNTWDIIRVLTMNGLAGVIFGLLYWRYGLLASMISHFIADLLLHVF